KERGIDIASITGDRSPDLPPIRGSSGGLPSFAAFNALPIEEQEKFTPEQRSRIYASDAQRRTRG
ncbi:MAG TPA: hypothetical protein VLA89_00255, partial [Gemmatimonadales bacterium]|nr:hypothetical protein [Gemmatimonadales bacterium]